MMRYHELDSDCWFTTILAVYKDDQLDLYARREDDRVRSKKSWTLQTLHKYTAEK